MVWYDFVIVAILIYTAWSGASRGLVSQLAWIVALVLCFKFADQLSPTIEPMIGVEQPLKHWIAMFVLYVGFSLASFAAARVLHGWIDAAKLKDFDRQLGGLFGLLKGVVIALVVTFFGVTLAESLRETILVSKTGYVACLILDSIEPWTPDDSHPLLKESLAKYKEGLRPIHEQLGHETSFPEIFGGPTGAVPESDTAAGNSNEPAGSGEFSFPDLLGGAFGGTSNSGLTGGGTSGGTGSQSAPTLQEVLRLVPQSLQQQIGQQIQDRWNASTPEQKRQLASELSRSFPDEVQSVVGGFMNAVGGQGTAKGGIDTSVLTRIGDLYGDRQTIVRQTQEHLAGVPASVQKAVLDDWYSDLTMQQNDPDPGTSVNTRIDERILRQLARAKVSLSQLSFDLQQRLKQSL
ncbi:MAG: CvpA family protein [Planctomycetaceae bacterium]